ncbi:hypothetical protein C8F01DRAFT_1087420 [Mycena amicta]|nr:hypothetical protein C8F01DRAFT_1087420 [Mycena amicta]
MPALTHIAFLVVLAATFLVVDTIATPPPLAVPTPRKPAPAPVPPFPFPAVVAPVEGIRAYLRVLTECRAALHAPPPTHTKERKDFLGIPSTTMNVCEDDVDEI